MEYNFSKGLGSLLNEIFKKYSICLELGEKLEFFGHPKHSTSSMALFNAPLYKYCDHLLTSFEGLLISPPSNDFLKEFEGYLDLADYLNDSSFNWINKMIKIKELNFPELHRRDKKKPFLFIFFDTETSDFLTPGQIEKFKEALNLDDKARLKRVKAIRKEAWAYPWVVGWKTIGEEFKYSFWDVDRHLSFINYLKDKNKGYSIILVGHNIQFDIDSMQPVFELYEIDTAAKLKDGDFHLTGYSENQDLFIGYLDTFHFYRQTLEKSAGIIKAPVPYDLANTAINLEIDLIRYFSRSTGEIKNFSLSMYIDYLRRDVEAVEQLHLKHLKLIEKLQKIAGIKADPIKLIHYSQSALSKWLVQEHFMDVTGRRATAFSKWYRPAVPVEEYDKERASVMGGWSPFNSLNINYECKDNEAIFKFDMVSMYPSIMIKGVPFGETVIEKMPGVKYITWARVQPIFQEELQFKPWYAHFSAELWHPYWFNSNDWASEIVVVKELWDIWGQFCLNRDEAFRFVREEYQMSDFIYGEVYKRVITIKKEADKVIKNPVSKPEEIKEAQQTRTIIKIILNGGYGKLMQKAFTDGDFKVGREKFNMPTPVEEYQSSKSGIYVAQMGRVLLATKVKALTDKGYKVLRCDTDSITVVANKKTGLEDLRKILGPETGKEGSWSFEGKYKNSYGFGVAKKYLLECFENEPPENKKSYIDKGVAFSGISGLPELFKYLYLNNLSRYLELKELITSGNNVLFKNCKTVSFKNKKYNQNLIETIDVLLVEDKNLKVCAEIEIIDNSRDFKILARY